MKTPALIAVSAAVIIGITSSVVLIGVAIDDAPPTMTTTNSDATASPAGTLAEVSQLTASTITAPDPQSTPTTKGLPDPATATLSAEQQLDADQVARTALAVLYSFDARVDTAEIDAASRASYLLDPVLADSLTQPAEDGASANWQVWTFTQAWSETTVIPTKLTWPLPADSRISAERVYIVQQTIHDAKGEMDEDKFTLQVSLARAGDAEPWRVTKIEAP